MLFGISALLHVPIHEPVGKQDFGYNRAGMLHVYWSLILYFSHKSPVTCEIHVRLRAVSVNFIQFCYMDELQEKYNQLVVQNEMLRKENTELKSLLCAHGIEYIQKRISIPPWI